MIPDIDLGSYIDHAILSMTAKPEDIEKGCREAQYFHFPAVCIYPHYVRYAAEFLHNKKTAISAVIGFPSGMSTSQTKLYEACQAVENGATELDVMLNLGLLFAGEFDKLHTEIAEICQETGKPIKAILETNLLDPEQIQIASEICLQAGVAYLKTNTGLFGGVKVEHVVLLSRITKGRIGIKASGGIRSFEHALNLIEAGATRLGTSRGTQIIEEMLDLQSKNI
jgi:deoxyribose-phosphate aldolase